MSHSLLLRTVTVTLSLPVVLVAFLASPARATTTFASWSSTTAATLGSNSLTFNSTEPTGLSLFSADLSGGNFSAAPGSSSQQALNYDENDPWSVTFNTTQPELMLDVVEWRGNGSGGTSTYTFNQPFTILSGLSAATVSGNTLTVPNSFINFYSGILEFSNVSTLSVTANTTSVSGIGLTFSTTTPVPEPATFALAGLGAAAMLFLRRRTTR